jgi:hypothetical protein
MPISTPGKSTLQIAIQDALKAARDSGSMDTASSDAVIADLSVDLTDAIDSFVKSIIVTINPGIGVLIPGPVPLTGNTISPGSS